ncbi:MAG: hypothetical protein IPL10_15620 [Bacteroidetes bacterium]|nr:hypothetical protein [Bacteroidota bacterium]
MDIDLVKLMASKSDEEVEDYLTNLQKYTPYAVYAAIDELKNAGRILQKMK